MWKTSRKSKIAGRGKEHKESSLLSLSDKSDREAGHGMTRMFSFSVYLWK